jgi:hypothetical protein
MSERRPRRPRNVIRAMWSQRAVHESGVADAVRDATDEHEARRYRQRLARIMMSIFDEVMLPIDREHPDLVPEEERLAVEEALRRMGASDPS